MDAGISNWSNEALQELLAKKLVKVPRPVESIEAIQNELAWREQKNSEKKSS